MESRSINWWVRSCNSPVGQDLVGGEREKPGFECGQTEPHLRPDGLQLTLTFCFLTLFSLSILILIKSD